MTKNTPIIDVDQLSGQCAPVWVRRVFTDLGNFAYLPDANRNQEWVENLIWRIDCGDLLALIPAIDGCAAGLYWAVPADGGLAFVHQFVMPEYRKGWLPVKIARACAAKAFDLLPEVSHMVGFTPTCDEFRGALLTAKRAGFDQTGIMPAYYDWHGAWHDCAILVKRRQ